MLNFNKKRYFIFLFISSMYVALNTVWFIHKDIGGLNVVTNLSSLNYFFDLQSSFSSMAIFFFFLAVFPFIYSYHVIDAKNTGFQNFIIVRIKSYSSYLKHIILTNALYVGVTFFIYKVIQLAICHFFINPLRFDDKMYIENNGPYILSANPLLNFILFFVLSLVGLIIFSMLVMVVGLYIKNTVVYLGSGLILSLICLLVPGFLNGYFHLKSSFLISSVFLETLITPFVGSMGIYAPKFSALSSFVAAAVFYLTITILLFVIWNQKRKKLS